uniref:Protein tyrosine phosphatase n=1 Tax=Panagrolaimus sp. JU765 TaxID=591449 RepID=A0AC34Q1J4_9BILA
MVNARPNLIDSVDQYIFIYDVLAEAVLCNIQPIAMHELKERSSMYRAKKDREKMELQDSHENKLLMMLTPMLKIGDCAGGHRMENRSKNRDVMVVPPDHARPYLQTLHGESKDYTYINAVEVDGFTRKSEYIVTEWPKQQTIDSFWTLIFDHSAHTVINLTNDPKSKVYPHFIHTKGKQNYGPFVVEVLNYQHAHTVINLTNDPKSKVYPHFIHTKGKQNYGPFVVEVLNYQQYPAMTSTMVKIQKRTFMISEIMATGATQQQIEAEVRICCIIQVRMWPMENKVPLSTSGLIELIKMSRAWRKRAPDRPETKPTIVMSHNGYSRCGIFIAANVCVDQMDMDHEVDVFHVVKMIRINRPQLIDMKDEYKYLYDLMLHWYMTNPEYRVNEVESSPSRESSEEPQEPIGNGTLVTNRPSIKSTKSISPVRSNQVYLS